MKSLRIVLTAATWLVLTSLCGSVAGQIRVELDKTCGVEWSAAFDLFPDAEIILDSQKSRQTMALLPESAFGVLRPWLYCFLVHCQLGEVCRSDRIEVRFLVKTEQQGPFMEAASFLGADFLSVSGSSDPGQVSLLYLVEAKGLQALADLEETEEVFVQRPEFPTTPGGNRIPSPAVVGNRNDSRFQRSGSQGQDLVELLQLRLAVTPLRSGSFPIPTWS